MSRTPGVVALVVSAWFSGLVVAARPLGLEHPLAPRHPRGPVPRFEPPPRFCEPRFAGQGCDLREDLSPEDDEALRALMREHGAAVERWQRERRPAALTAGFWRRTGPWLALAWSALAAALVALALRGGPARRARPA